MDETAQTSCVAFAGDRCIASGPLPDVAVKVKAFVDRGEHAPILVFDGATSRQIEIDLRGTAENVLARLGEAADGAAPRGPGRPKLGVVAREVTLLPRHWEWLSGQPGGASVALRNLVEQAMRANAGKDRIRESQNAVYRFMSVMAGDRLGFEEAARALFAGDEAKFNR